MTDLRTTLGAVEVDRDVVHVSGPDAVSYLQGQLSQDVEDLDVGATSWTFVLQPTGKVDVWARVTRSAADVFLLDVDGGSGDALAQRLRRFLLRTKADVELPGGWRCVALRGPGAEAAARLDHTPAELRAPAGWPGIEGADLLGPWVALPKDLPIAEPGDYEAARIRAGVPAMGRELTEKTIPAEVGQWVIDASVDFTKGCYTGQELVARIDSRGGNVPRHLRGIETDGEVPVGAAVLVDGAEVGTVTSAAAGVALAYVGRAVPVGPDGVPAQLRWDGGEAPGRLRPLPLG